MKLRLLALATLFTLPALAQQHEPHGVREALENLSSQPSTHTSFTLDRDMLASADRFLNDGAGPPAQLSGITFESFRFHQPAFYIPEEMHHLIDAYSRAGWKHLVDQNGGPAESASPTRTQTDLWLHMHGANIDGMTVLLRGQKEMTVIGVSGELRPLDLVHLSGHFGIPKVDPNAVMVPAPDGR